MAPGSGRERTRSEGTSVDRGGERGGSSVPDEVWEEFLRTSADDAGDAPKEPSARAREVTGRLRAEPAEPDRKSVV